MNAGVMVILNRIWPFISSLAAGRRQGMGVIMIPPQAMCQNVALGEYQEIAAAARQRPLPRRG